VENAKTLGDDWRFENPPKQFKFQEAIEILKHRHVSYDDLWFNDCPPNTRYVSLKSTPKPTKLTVLITLHERYETLHAHLHFLHMSIAALTSSHYLAGAIRIRVVEIDDAPGAKDLVRGFNEDYVFLSTSVANATGSMDQFPKSLAYNIGIVMGPPSEYYLFYDVDILTPVEFFMTLSDRLVGGATHFKCFTDWFRLTPELSNEIRERIPSVTEACGTSPQSYQCKKDNLAPIYDTFTKDMSKHSKQLWAPGGAILVKKDLVYRVGGYDSEFFFGWGSEDEMFALKLSVEGGMADLQTPLYHLWHWRNDTWWSNARGNMLYWEFVGAGMNRDEFLNLKRSYLTINSQSWDV